MQLKDFVVQPCKSRLAFEFLPKKKESLELGKIADALKRNDLELEVETPFMLIVLLNKKQITVFKSGKILVKETETEQEARKTAELLMQKME